MMRCVHPARDGVRVMPISRFLAGALVLLCGGCSEDLHQAEHRPNLPPASLPGVYSGIFPCTNCEGIATMLWLRPDHAFFMRSSYLDENQNPSLEVHGLGRWHWDTEQHALVLVAPGPERLFARPDPDRLRLVTRSEMEHTLLRDPAAPDFVDEIRIQGQLAIDGRTIRLTECLTAVTAEIEHEQAYSRLVRQARRFGTPAMLELEGRFNWDGDESPPSLVVTGVMSYKPGEHC